MITMQSHVWCEVICEGQHHSLSQDAEHPIGYLKSIYTTLPLGVRIQWILYPKRELVIHNVALSQHAPVQVTSQLTFNGYQSWTDTQPLFVHDRMPRLSSLAKPLLSKYHFDKYGDTHIKMFKKGKGCFHGFTYVEVTNDEQTTLLVSCDEKSGFTIIEYAHRDGNWVVTKDNRGLCIHKPTICLDLVCLSGSQAAVFDAWANILDMPTINQKPCTGWTSWYYHYQNINASILLDNIEALSMAQPKVDIVQIDDGYQSAIGDWLHVDKTKFPQGMKPIADSIKQHGFTAGLWLAPCVCQLDSIIAKQHPDWLVKDNHNKPLLGGGNWGGFYILDMDNEAVRQYLKNVFHIVLYEWGFDMVKLDFLYAACLQPTRFKTRGQLMHETMVFMRECVGDKLILGCGVPLASAFGIVDFCRIGCDVGLDYNGKWYMKYFHRERISTYHAINNTIGRFPLHNRFFLNDPDVIILRKEGHQLSDNQKYTLAVVNKLMHGLLFTSDDVSLYDEPQKALFAWCMNHDMIEVTSVRCERKGVYTIITRIHGLNTVWTIDTHQGLCQQKSETVS